MPDYSIKVDFSWTPTSAALSWTVNGNTYPYSTQQDAIVRGSDSRYPAVTTPNNTLLTFTAAVTPPSGITILEYRWEWGDGEIGFGVTASHTYKVSAPETQANLIVTDSNRNVWNKSKVLNLRFANQIVVSGNNAVS